MGDAPAKALGALLSAFPGFLKGRSEAPWLARLRESAADFAFKAGFPTTSDEEWVHTGVEPIADSEFTLPENGSSIRDLRGVPFSLNGGERIELVFVNGRFSAPLSSVSGLPQGMEVASLREVLAKSPQRLEPYLGKTARPDRDAFTALNTAFFEDGAWVFLPRGLALKQPVHLLFFSEKNSRLTVSSPRNLIVAEAGSEGSIFETYFGPAGPYWTNSVTEISAGWNSAVRHAKIQEEGAAAFHIGTTACHQHQTSRFTSHSVQIGGSLVRSNVDTLLDAEGAECALNGLFIATGSQHIDNHTTIDHAKPHCSSRELYKGILAQQSRGVFDGKIVVRPDAQKTDARQTSRNLLLSEDAQVDCTPRLEILADDVKCAHGATIGSLDENAIFYFRSRGIGRQDARRILTHAFANEIVDGIPHDGLREKLSRDLFGYFSGVSE